MTVAQSREHADTPASSVTTAHDSGADVEMNGKDEKIGQEVLTPTDGEANVEGPSAVLGEAKEEGDFPEGGLRAWSVVFGTGMVMAFRWV